MTIASAEPLEDHAEYGAAGAIIEILVDAGLLADERLVRSERFVVRQGTTGYSILLEPADS